MKIAFFPRAFFAIAMQWTSNHVDIAFAFCNPNYDRWNKNKARLLLENRLAALDKTDKSHANFRRINICVPENVNPFKVVLKEARKIEKKLMTVEKFDGPVESVKIAKTRRTNYNTAWSMRQLMLLRIKDELHMGPIPPRKYLAPFILRRKDFLLAQILTMGHP